MTEIKLKDGGSLDFKKLFDEYFYTLVLFSEHYLFCRPDSESLVQDTFIALWKKRCDFAEPRAVKAWLYATVRNKALNVLKHRKIESEYAEALAVERESEAYYMKSLIDEETRRLLLAAINSLPKYCREVCLLNFDGLDNQEIAKVMNISVDTVKFHKKKAYRLLREKLGDYFYLLPFLSWQFLLSVSSRF